MSNVRARFDKALAKEERIPLEMAALAYRITSRSRYRLQAVRGRRNDESNNDFASSGNAMKLLNYFKALLLFSASILCLAAAMFLSKLEKPVEATVTNLGVTSTKAQGFLDSMKLPAMNALAQLAASGKVLSQDLAQQREAFASEKASYDSLTKHVGEVLDAARTDLTKLGAATDSLGTIAPTLNSSIGAIVKDTHDTLTQATTTLADPAIHDTFVHVDGAAANFETVTADLGSTTKHFDHISADAENYVHAFVQPPSKPKQVLDYLLHLTYLGSKIAW